MAYPTLVGSVADLSGTIDTMHFVPTLPSGSAGDLIVIFFLCSSVETMSASGYTTLYNGSASGSLTLWIAYKTAGSSESAPILATSAPCDSVTIVRRFADWTSIELGTANNGSSSTATVSSHTVSGSADRTWISIMGSENDQSSASLPSLSNAIAENTGVISIHSGTSNTTSNTVSLGSYGLTTSSVWITNAVIVSGTSGGGGVTLDVNATLGNVTSSISLLHQNLLSVSAALGNVTSSISLLQGNQASIAVALGDVFPNVSLYMSPDTTVRLGDITTDIALGVNYAIPLGPVELLSVLYTFSLVTRCKVWNGSAWVSAPPKYYNGSAWVDATDIKVYIGGAWTRLD